MGSHESTGKTRLRDKATTVVMEEEEKEDVDAEVEMAMMGQGFTCAKCGCKRWWPPPRWPRWVAGWAATWLES